MKVLFIGYNKNRFLILRESQTMQVVAGSDFDLFVTASFKTQTYLGDLFKLN